MFWSPLAWAGRSLVDLGAGRWLSGTALFLVTVGLSAGIFAISLATAERLYYSGWARVQVSTRSKRAARPSRRAASGGLPFAALVRRVVPSPVRAIVVKDFMMLRRDLRNMSQLVTPLILGILYAFMLIRGGGEPPAGRGEAPAEFMAALSGLMVYANVGISLFVSWSLLSRLAGMAFSQEGKSYWLLKASPVSTGEITLCEVPGGISTHPGAGLGVSGNHLFVAGRRVGAAGFQYGGSFSDPRRDYRTEPDFWRSWGEF